MRETKEDQEKEGLSQRPPGKKKKKKNAEEVKQELRELSKGEGRPPVDLTKIFRNIAIVVVLVWIVAFILSGTWKGSGAYVFGAAGEHDALKVVLRG